MATATATPTIDPSGPKGLRIFQDIDMAHVWGTIAVQGAPATYQAGGLALSWNIYGFPSRIPPYHVRISSVAGHTYDYRWNATTGNMQIFSSGTELADGTVMPGGVSSDTIRFETIVQRS